jgi:glucan phosphoethanolaminetransferase (alkaline phosphatase superfamily)
MNIIPMLSDVTVTSSSGGLGQGLILLVVAVIVLSFLWWVIQNYVPEPMRKWAVLVLVLLCVLILCNFVMSFNGHAFIHW